MGEIRAFVRKAACLACGFAVFGCASLLHSPAERADTFAVGAGFRRFDIAANPLRVYVRAPSASAAGADRPELRRLEIHIESDGAPWLAADLPPRDPTPRSLISLQIAAAGSATATAYIGRPCQYLDGAALAQCDSSLWRQARYSEAAVAAVDAAVSALVRDMKPSSIALIGYSGGGAIAAHIAARRSDVSCLVSIAAPLDTHAWTQAIGVSALSRSLNPTERPARVAQTHFTGAADKDVPPDSIRRYLARATNATEIQVPGFDHECCRARAWPRLREQSCLAL